MGNLRHFYYQNKDKIWKVAIIIAFILVIIYYFNYRASHENNENNIANVGQNVTYYDEQNKTYVSEQSAITGEIVTQQEVQKVEGTISKFLQYCKNGNLEQAYNMLSQDCKQSEYNTLEDFQNKYVNNKFDKNSIYEIQKWLSNTYKISISNDILSTGNVSNNQKRVEYITIVTENSEQKLNVNGYIGETKINESVTQNKVKVTAVSKKVYIDYEIYDFEVENLSQNTIKMDSLQKIGTMYLVDSKGNKYNAYSNEILDEMLEIRGEHKFGISIKYANVYSNRTSISKITFENVILDYARYKTTQDIKQFKDICQITIDL